MAQHENTAITIANTHTHIACNKHDRCTTQSEWSVEKAIYFWCFRQNVCHLKKPISPSTAVASEYTRFCGQCRLANIHSMCYKSINCFGPCFVTFNQWIQHSLGIAVKMVGFFPFNFKCESYQGYVYLRLNSITSTHTPKEIHYESTHEEKTHHCMMDILLKFIAM